MAEAKIAAKQPAAVQVEAGKTYYYCTCGESKRQPLCDGAHKGTEFTPKAFKAETTGEVWLCQCKRTHTPPFCDGSHHGV